MLWVDEYRPRTLGKMMVHVEEAQHLKNLTAQGDCPHLLFYGPTGAGKKTLIMALLREMYCITAEKPWKRAKRSMMTSSSKPELYLVGMYAKCGSIEDAKGVVDNMAERGRSYESGKQFHNVYLFTYQVSIHKEYSCKRDN